MKRIAALTLVLAACSAPPVTPRPPAPPPPRDATPVDAEAPVAVEPPPEAAGPPCLPRKAEPWFGARGVIVACDFQKEPRVCHEVRPDGAVTAVPAPPAPLHAKTSGRLVEVCPDGGGECTLFDPSKADELRLYMADVDLTGQLATVVLRVEGTRTAVVEIWDVNKPRRLARTTLASRGTPPSGFYAWFLGRTILIGVDADEVTEYSLWKRDGATLKRFATLDRQPKVWVVLDDRYVAMRWEDGGVDILDARTGRIAHEVAWKTLLPGPTKIEGVFLAKLGDRRFAVAPYDADRALLGLGVGDTEGKVTRYPVTFCP